ncbi:MAG: aminopeptidase [Saprospiraceae bacterium]|nr:aminopeptidase [Saprospiraceae bacterium]
MKRLVFSLLAGLFSIALTAQNNPEAYSFTPFKMLTATPVKDQQQTGTCWAFSSASFLESELIRTGKGQVNLSEMYIVRHVYRQKCENYVRRQGQTRFSEGGLAHDLINAAREYGVVPEEVYPGRKDSSKPFNHGPLEKSLKNLCDKLIDEGKAGTLKANWTADIDKALDAEFGPVPTQFSVGGTQFTPLSYLEFLGLNLDDYVTITSFTHHPYYKPFVLEIPDNFAHGSFYNLPLNELMRSLTFSLQTGYTVTWDADVSNEGFSAQNGLAIVPQKDWSAKSTAEQNATFKYWEPEKDVNQEYRQQMFDRQITQDDHLMHVVGILDEVHSGVYYVVKNSWGEISDLKGYVYVSEDYMRLNTISFTVNKNALPPDVRKRLGFEPGEVKIEKQMGPGAIPPKTDPADMQPAGRVRTNPAAGRTPTTAPTAPKKVSKKE